MCQPHNFNISERIKRDKVLVSVSRISSNIGSPRGDSKVKMYCQSSELKDFKSQITWSPNATPKKNLC